jgi:hypothetical protein
MAKFEIKKIIKSDELLQTNTVRREIIQCVERSKSLEVSLEQTTDDCIIIRGQSGDRVFRSLVSLKAEFRLQVEGTKALIKVSGTTSPYWRNVLLGVVLCIPGAVILAGILPPAIYIYQSRNARRLMEKFLDEVASELEIQFTGSPAVQGQATIQATKKVAQISELV